MSENTSQNDGSQFGGFLNNGLKGALGFIAGGLAGSVFLYLTSRFGLINSLVQLVDQTQVFVRLVNSLIFVILFIFLSGAVHGALAGLALHKIDRLAACRRYITSGALAMAVTQVVLVLPLILLTALLSLYNNLNDGEVEGFLILFTFYGLLYGLLFGLLLGIFSLGLRLSLRVILVSVAGGMLGGAIIGLLLRWISQWVDRGGDPPGVLLLLGMQILFNLCLGAALGSLYGYYAKKRVETGALPYTIGRTWKIIGGVASVLLILGIASTANKIIQFVTINEGSISSVFPSKTIGVAWDEPSQLELVTAGRVNSTDIASNQHNQLAAVWSQNQVEHEGIFFSYANLAENGKLKHWSDPSKLSSFPTALPAYPQISASPSNDWRLVWVESSQTESNDQNIRYSTCGGDSCSEPLTLSGSKPITCPAGEIAPEVKSWSSPVAIAVDESGWTMVVWNTSDGGLAYSTFSGVDSPPSEPSGCVPLPSDQPGIAAAPRLTSSQAGRFTLAFQIEAEENHPQVYISQFSDGAWSTESAHAGAGAFPEVFNDDSGAVHLAWCGNDQGLRYQLEGGKIEQINFPECVNRPALTQKADGRLHLLWYSPEIENNHRQQSDGHFIYESIHDESGWTPPVLVSNSAAATQPAATSDSSGDLHMLWADPIDFQGKLLYAQQPIYQCDASRLSRVNAAILQSIQSGPYRPREDTIPYCGNQFERLIYMPGPIDDTQPTPSAGFDKVNDLIRSARYEVLFITMEYQEDAAADSPGYVLTEAVVDLYNQLKENPEKYPKGLTVRIMLGNYPVISSFNWGDQIYSVVDNLRKAGLPELENPDLGWKVEIANFDGQLPHSHSKFVVVDGKKAASAGFNYSYMHYPKEHPSGLGVDLIDLGMQLTGPIAQEAMRAYDDMWDGANQLVCKSLDPPFELWSLHCNFQKAEATHIPEVLQYYLTDSESNSFSLFHSSVYLESDRALIAALSSAQTSIDIFQTNFSLDAYCALEIVNEGICSYEDSLPWMEAIMTAIEDNQTRVRVLVTDVNMNGIENMIALETMTDELVRRGLDEFVELRFYNGRMHSKAVSIDGELLVVGSQNFHYSAWEEGSLTEYNLTTDDPEAIRTFEAAFEYYWQNASPAVTSTGVRTE